MSNEGEQPARVGSRLLPLPRLKGTPHVAHTPRPAHRSLLPLGRHQQTPHDHMGLVMDRRKTERLAFLLFVIGMTLGIVGLAIHLTVLALILSGYGGTQ